MLLRMIASQVPALITVIYIGAQPLDPPLKLILCLVLGLGSYTLMWVLFPYFTGEKDFEGKG